MGKTRIGLVGFGYIGHYIFEQIRDRTDLGLEIGFVHNRSPQKLTEVGSDKILACLKDFAAYSVDLVVEVAHPDITLEYGAAFLAAADYMPLSLTALADAQVEEKLRRTAEQNGRRLFVPHGAVVGLDALEEGREMWDEVSITMKKPLRSLDFSAAADLGPQGIEAETVLYDGPARGVCPLFPRNVNSHAAVALAGIGFERTRSVLVADPALEDSIIEVRARGGGVELDIRRANPMQGVSGVFTLMSTLASIGRAGVGRPGLQVC
jgi:aspartate dehydrogenase